MMVGVDKDMGVAVQRIAVQMETKIFYLTVADAHWLMNRLRASIAAVKKVEASK